MSTPAEASAADALLDEIVSEAGLTGPRCYTGPFIASLPATDQAGIATALRMWRTGERAPDGRAVQLTAISRFLVKRGYPGAASSAEHHLRGDCRCRTR